MCELSEAPIKTGIYCVDGKCREMKDGEIYKGKRHILNPNLPWFLLITICGLLAWLSPFFPPGGRVWRSFPQLAAPDNSSQMLLLTTRFSTVGAESQFKILVQNQCFYIVLRWRLIRGKFVERFGIKGTKRNTEKYD